MKVVCVASDPTDDQALVRLAQSGSADAFEQLVQRYRERIVEMACRLTRDKDEAQDIAQDSLTRAFMHLAQFRLDRPFAAWLFVTARNASLDLIRKRHRQAAYVAVRTPFLLEPGPEYITLRHYDADQVRLALRSLPTRLREVLSLYYVFGMTYNEIADYLQIPLGSVKTSIFRAKQRLRTVLVREGNVAFQRSGRVFHSLI